MQIGQVASVRRVFSQDDFDRFAALSGDDNPIHVDAEFAARTGFGRTVAHGMLLYSAVCAALGERLPGPGAVQLEQELMFPSATFVSEQVSIQLEVTKVQPAQRLAELSTLVARPDGNVGLQGRTLVRLPSENPFQRPGAQPSSSTPHPPEPQTLKGLETGQATSVSRSFTLQDLAEYAALSGDANPVFSDAAYARRLGLAGPLVPGGLLGGLFSYLLGTQLPGRGTNYLKQRLEFLAPAYPGQELTATVEIVRIRPEKQLVNLSTVCANPAGEIVCRGEALVLVKDVGVKRKT
jgi:acyl dehydratase